MDTKKNRLSVKAMLIMLAIVVAVAFSVVLTFGIVGVGHAEDFTPDKVVNSEAEWDEAVTAALAAEDKSTPYKIQLGADLNSDNFTKYNFNQWNSNVIIDVNGHKISGSQYPMISNFGKLEIVDYSPDKKGLVEYTKSGYGYIFDNYNELTLNVNVKADLSDNAMAVMSEIYIQNVTSSDSLITPKVTINGGNISGGNIANLIDSELTINDGIFAFKSEAISIMSRNNSQCGKANMDPSVMTEFHKGQVEINNGTFKGTNLIHYEINTSINPEPVKLSNFSVTINNGTFSSYDASWFVAEGKWAPKEKGVYVVKDIDDQVESAAAAKLVLNNDSDNGSYRTYYFDNFDDAFTAAKNLPKPKFNIRKLTLLKDYETTSALSLSKINGGSTYTCDEDGDGTKERNSDRINLNVDLNGHTVKISNINGHILCGSGSNVDLNMTSSVDGAKLILDYPSGVNFASNARPGIRIDNTTNTLNMHFENISIERTGYVPANYYGFQKNLALINFETMYNATVAHNISFKNCDIISSLTYGVADPKPAEDEMPAEQPSDAGYLAAFTYGSGNGDIDYDITADGKFGSDKKSLLTFEVDEDRQCRCSWDISYFLPTGFVCLPDGNGEYIVAKASETCNYLIGHEEYATLSEAVANCPEGETIFVVQDVTEKNIVILDKPVNITMKENNGPTVTFEQGLVITKPVTITNGNLAGNITVATDVTLKDLKILGTLTTAVASTLDNVTIDSQGAEGNALTVSGGELTLKNGEIIGKISANGKLQIIGGKYSEDPSAYVAGGFKAESGEDGYNVIIGASQAAKDWLGKQSGNIVKVTTPEEWLYIAGLVNDGTTDFSGKLVKVENDLDFTGYIYLPIGTAGHVFRGAVDGQIQVEVEPNTVRNISVRDIAVRNAVISNVVVHEVCAGLFGNAVFGTAEGVTGIQNITLENSEFVTDYGMLDENNGSSYPVGGAIVADSKEGFKATNVIIRDVLVSCGTATGSNMFYGGLLGHTYGTLNVQGCTLERVTVNGVWKWGGILGFSEGNTIVEDTTVTELNLGEYFSSSSSAGIVIGNASNGSSVTLKNDKFDMQDANIIGTGDYYGKDTNVYIEGSDTDIHANGIGPHVEGVTFRDTLGEGPDSHNFELELNEEIPEDKLDLSEVKGGIVEKDENGKVNYSAVDYLVAIHRADAEGAVEFVKGYKTLNEAFADVQDGDIIEVYNKLSGETASLNKEGVTVTIVSNGYAIFPAETEWTINATAGTIVFGDDTITIDGKVTVNGDVQFKEVTNNGTLTLNGGTVTKITNNNELTANANSNITEVSNTKTLTVNGGAIGTVTNTGEGAVTMNSGSIETATGGNLFLNNGKVGTVTDVTTLSVKNGEVTEATATNVTVEAGKVGTVKAETLTVTGGEIETATATTVTLSVGKITTLNATTVTLNSGSIGTVTATTVTMESGAIGTVTATTLVMHNGTIDGNVTVNDNGTLTVESGTIGTVQATADDAMVGTLTVGKSSAVNISGGTINSDIVLTDDATTLNVTGGTFADGEFIIKQVGTDKLALETVAAVDNGKYTLKTFADVAENEILVAGKSATEIVRKHVTAGYAVIAEEDTYAIRDITAYYPVALKTLKAYEQGLEATGLYSETGLTNLGDIYEETAQELNALTEALTMDEIDEIIVAAQARMDAVQTDEQERDTLARSKESAILELKLFAASMGVSPDDKLVTDGIDAINAATDPAGVTDALNTAEQAIYEVKQAADAEAELKAAKASAVDLLKAYASARGVSVDNAAVKDGIDKINKATATAAVETELNNALAAIDKIAADRDEAANLAAAKSDAIEALRFYAIACGVSPEDKSVTDGIDAINDALTTNAVTQELTKAKTNVDSAKAAADKALEDMAAAASLASAKASAIDDLRLYAMAKGVALTDKSVTDGIAAINAATDEAAVSSTYDAAVKGVDAAAEALAEANAPKGLSTTSIVVIVIAVIILVVVIIALLFAIKAFRKKED